MKFLLYNIRYGTGKHLIKRFKHIRGYLSRSEKQIDRIGKFIRRQNPDIVGLVEVDLGSFRMKSKNQAKILSEMMDKNFIYQYKYEENSKYMKFPMVRKQGNALLSNKKIVNHKFHYLDNGMKKLIIEIETNGVVIFLVHLALGGKTRMKQFVQLFSLIEKCEKPMIVAGDFNTLWGTEEIELFMKAGKLKSANLDRKPTFPSWSPKKELDFVLHSENIKINDVKVIKTMLSDHLPILIDFDII